MSDIDMSNVKIEEVSKEEWAKRVKELSPDFKIIYDKLLVVLKKYCDLRQDHYSLVALWIIGTFMHDKFSAYPYLYFNAMRGSGKSRLMQLISRLCWKGKVCVNMSESVLFRTAALRTLCIDEFEGAVSKEKATLMELLNAAYKKGNSVERAIKRKGIEGEKWEIESYNVYCPICIANISGMDNVLSDRCITLILEKSALKSITRMIEEFDSDPLILELISLYEHFSVGCACRMTPQNTNLHWNEYISNKYKPTLPTHTTLLTQPTQPTPNNPDEYFKEQELFEKIEKTSLDGRHLELFFPIFLIADQCGILDETIITAEKIIKEKKEEDITGNRDVSLIMMLTQFTRVDDFILVKSIAEKFNEDEDADKNNKINSEYIGRALKRLNLITEKRRVNRGTEVKINWKKVDEKARMFKLDVPEKAEEIHIK